MSDEEFLKRMKRFLDRGVPPEVIENDSDECKEYACENAETKAERAVLYKRCLVKKLEGASLGQKKKKYFD